MTALVEPDSEVLLVVRRALHNSGGKAFDDALDEALDVIFVHFPSHLLLLLHQGLKHSLDICLHFLLVPCTESAQPLCHPP